MLDLAFSGDDARVVGVIVQDRDGGTPALLPADLVVDATGTGLADAGVARTARLPGAGRRRSVASTSATRRTASARPPTARPRGRWRWRPGPGLHRGGIMLAEEGGSPAWSAWSAASACGRPSAWPEFLAWAGTLSSSRAGRRAGGLEPLDEGATYRFPANRRRHYEDLTEFPEGLVVVGDALCAFDPVYGQGMTVAAIEAVALGRCLQHEGPGSPRRFHRAAAGIIDTPWTIAVGGVPDDAGQVPWRQPAGRGVPRPAAGRGQ